MSTASFSTIDKKATLDQPSQNMLRSHQANGRDDPHQPPSANPIHRQRNIVIGAP
jgi:hypothetical protein